MSVESAQFLRQSGKFLDEELIPYRYSSCCCTCWGKTLQKMPKASSFQIGSTCNLAGLFSR